MSEFKKEARTLFASKAMELSDMFAIKFGVKAFEGNPRRMVKLQPPSESTGGGAQAREAIVLLPVGQETNGLMAGWADVASKAAELRTFRSLGEVYRQRHGAPLQMDEAQYNAFVAEAQTFFAQEGFAMVLNDQGPPAGAASSSQTMARQPSGGGGSNMILFFVFASLAIAIGLGLGWFLFGRGGA